MKLCDIFRLMRVVFIIFCVYKKIILLISSMFRNQLNCCKYKSRSSSCTEHRAKYCERQNMRRNHEQRFRETHAPATSETEMPCSANEPAKWNGSKHTTLEQSKTVKKRIEWKTRSVLIVCASLSACVFVCVCALYMLSQCLMFASCISFAMLLTLAVHMTSVRLRPKTAESILFFSNLIQLETKTDWMVRRLLNSGQFSI